MARFSEWLENKSFILNENRDPDLQYSPASKQFYEKLLQATDILEKPETIEKLLFIDPRTFQDVAEDVSRVVASHAYNLPPNENASGAYKDVYEAGEKIIGLLDLLNSPEIEAKAKQRRAMMQQMNLFRQQMMGLGAGIHRLGRRIEAGTYNLD